MGLIKKITFNNGIEVNYHRIGDIQLDNKNKKTRVSMVSYVKEEYRIKEKENLAKQIQYEELVSSIISENEKPYDDRDVEQVVAWSDEANELVGTFEENLDLSVFKADIDFEDLTDISMNNIYNLIKQDYLFEDSVDSD